MININNGKYIKVGLFIFRKEMAQWIQLACQIPVKITINFWEKTQNLILPASRKVYLVSQKKAGPQNTDKFDAM